MDAITKPTGARMSNPSEYIANNPVDTPQRPSPDAAWSDGYCPPPAPKPERQSRGPAFLGMMLSLAGIGISLVTFFGAIIGIPLCLVGMAFSTVGLVEAKSTHTNRSLAIAAMLVSTVPIAILVVVMVMLAV